MQFRLSLVRGFQNWLNILFSITVVVVFAYGFSGEKRLNAITLTLLIISFIGLYYVKTVVFDWLNKRIRPNKAA
jgi:hypothetical protein